MKIIRMKTFVDLLKQGIQNIQQNFHTTGFKVNLTKKLLSDYNLRLR